jgi:hypothetical protein
MTGKTNDRGRLVSEARMEKAQFYVIFVLTFVAFFTAAILSRLLPWRAAVKLPPEQRKSFLAEVWRASSIATCGACGCCSIRAGR